MEAYLHETYLEGSIPAKVVIEKCKEFGKSSMNELRELARERDILDDINTYDKERLCLDLSIEYSVDEGEWREEKERNEDRYEDKDYKDPVTLEWLTDPVETVERLERYNNSVLSGIYNRSTAKMMKENRSRGITGGKIDSIDNDQRSKTRMKRLKERVDEYRKSRGLHSGRELLEREFVNALERGNVERIGRLLSSRGGGRGGMSIDIDSPLAIDESLYPPLAYAAKYDKADVVKALIEAGANVNVINDDGYSPLHYAVFECNRDVVKALIDGGANVDIEDINGDTPLVISSTQGTPEILSMLITAGANVDKKDREGNTLLHNALREQNIDFALTLIDSGADLETRNNKGEQALHIALWYIEDDEDESSIRLLLAMIDKGAGVNSLETGEHEWSPLGIAVDEDKDKYAKLLIDAGADVNMGLFGVNWTPLHIAAEKGYSKVVKTLLEAGANVNSIGGHGQTPIYAAAKMGRSKVVKILLEAGARVDIATDDDYTPLRAAREKLSLARERGRVLRVSDYEETIRLLEGEREKG